MLMSLKKIKMKNSDIWEQIWKRPGPKNDEDPSNKILKILNMGPISTRKHEMEMW